MGVRVTCKGEGSFERQTCLFFYHLLYDTCATCTKNMHSPVCIQKVITFQNDMTHPCVWGLYSMWRGHTMCTGVNKKSYTLGEESLKAETHKNGRHMATPKGFLHENNCRLLLHGTCGWCNNKIHMLQPPRPPEHHLSSGVHFIVPWTIYGWVFHR